MGALTQIKTAYEVNGMSPQQIAEAEDLDLAAVKGALMQGSSKYRKDCGLDVNEGDDGLNFTDEELRQVNRAIFELAMASEDEHIRTKNLHYIRDDKKGRKESARQLGNTTFNILQFNEQLQQARERATLVKQKLIEV